MAEYRMSSQDMVMMRPAVTGEFMQNFLYCDWEIDICKMLPCAVCDHGYTGYRPHTYDAKQCIGGPGRSICGTHQLRHITDQTNKLSSTWLCMYVGFIHQQQKVSGSFYKISWNVTLTKNPKHDRLLSLHVKYRDLKIFNRKYLFDHDRQLKIFYICVSFVNISVSLYVGVIILIFYNFDRYSFRCQY